MSFIESEFQYQAEEWLGAKEDSRLVSVQLKLKCQLNVLSARGTRLRTINMDFIEEVQIWISNNKGQKTIVVKMPKEYDMVNNYCENIFFFIDVNKICTGIQFHGCHFFRKL